MLPAEFLKKESDIKALHNYAIILSAIVNGKTKLILVKQHTLTSDAACMFSNIFPAFSLNIFSYFFRKIRSLPILQ